MTITATAPPGRYVARVRALAGLRSSLTTADVSFAVGPPDVPGAPLDFSVITDGTRVTFAWQPPSTGAPPRYEIEAGSGLGRRDIGTLAVTGTATSLALDVPIGAYWARLVAVNGAGRSQATNDVFFDLAPRFTCVASPPMNLVATVSGHIVTLTWQPSDDDADAPVRIVAGLGPGLSDVGIIEAPPYASTFSIAAPPGTYFVRLKTGCFEPSSSNEVIVVVP